MLLNLKRPLFLTSKLNVAEDAYPKSLQLLIWEPPAKEVCSNLTTGPLNAYFKAANLTKQLMLDFMSLQKWLTQPRVLPVC